MEARVRHSSRASDTTPGETGGDVSDHAPVIPEDDDPMIPDIDATRIPDADVSLIPEADAPMAHGVDDPCIRVDADSGRGLSGILITQCSSFEIQNGSLLIYTRGRGSFPDARLACVRSRVSLTLEFCVVLAVS